MLEWDTSCPDWQDRIIAGRSLITSPPLFPAEAEQGLQYFNDLMVVDVVGTPTFGEIARPWITEFVAAIFGACDPDTGERLINEFFLLISKKNGKSTLAAGIMITALLMNWRESAEFIILAPSLKVANNSAKPAMDMVQRDPDLFRMLKPIPHERKIVHRTTGASLTVVAADSDIVGGIKATGILIDELWLFGKKNRAMEMLREATGGLASRPEGFVIALSTQSDEPPTGVFKDWLDRFRDIREGKIVSKRSLGLLYEFPPAMIKSEAFKKPENFYITNPNMGASVSERFLLEEWEKERLKGQKALVGFFAKHMNVQPGMAARSDSWAGAEFWKRRAVKGLDLDALLARSEVIVIGLDGGGLDDLYGLTILGREATEVELDAAIAGDEEGAEETPLGKKRIKRWLSWSHAWVHKVALDRRQTMEPKIRECEAAGEITVLDDDEVAASGLPADIDQILAIIRRVKDAGLLYCVAVDPAGLGEMIEALADEGITQENKEFERDFVIGAPQGFGMMNALKTAERKLANRTLHHADQALMDWCVGNLKIESTATAIRATKQNAGDDKIDPAMALFNATTMMATNPPACRSVYEERGLIVL